ncbi:hypothetical protein BP5796_10455 [Coleophoma crateriformis]|uniref:CBS domain-containing protein n=1 Tax=Coleophoma crateriformis TaxID=565419 RepID=A0A3D8QQ59_9HELO|nr:hypothetical protein BP5796_10455 [Coleophoma crateriformis]
MTDPTAAPAVEGPLTMSHRASFVDNLRQSPRSQRHPSFTQAAVQELLNHPPAPKIGDPRFAGRDWQQIRVGELVQKSDVKFIGVEDGIEKATKLLCESGPPNVVLLRAKATDRFASGTFDFSDLNAYLLVVLGLATPEGPEQVDILSKIQKAVREGNSISLSEVSLILRRDPLVTLPESADLSKATEIFGSGVHRILELWNEVGLSFVWICRSMNTSSDSTSLRTIRNTSRPVCKEGTDDVIGILSQLKLVEFLWDNASSFPVIEQLYSTILRDLNVGTHHTIAINGDKPLTEALQLMNLEGLTSVAVVDNGLNVVGNISTADTKLLTSTSAMPLLKSSCIHFISVILSERGVENGRDSYPVFHVTPYSTLAHTVAKLVATRSHRMWVVESASPSPSTPLTPSASHTVLAPQFGSTPASPSLTPSHPSVSASALPGAGISGRLTGVISLTDILNLYARQSGLHPLDPNDQRDRRRRSSSSSLRPSIDFGRQSSFDIRR